MAESVVDPSNFAGLKMKERENVSDDVKRSLLLYRIKEIKIALLLLCLNFCFAADFYTFYEIVTKRISVFYRN